jgi:hypothetical protein
MAIIPGKIGAALSCVATLQADGQFLTILAMAILPILGYGAATAQG